MPRNGSGSYNLPANALAIANTTASSTYFNNLVNDLATALTGSASADGQTTLTGQFKGYAGSASNPTWTFSAESSTGWYQSAAGKLTSAIAGVKGPELDSTGITNLAAINGAPISGFRNVIRNPEMTVNQRPGVTTVAASNSAYTLDGWILSCQGASGTFTAQQNTTVLTVGSPNCLAIQNTVTRTPAAAETFFLAQLVEGNMFARFGFGTANAVPVTLSFWAQGSVTGTYSVALQNGTAARSYVNTFSLTSATPTKITFTIPGDTSGTWATDTTAGAILKFDLGSGSNFENSALSWLGGNYTRTSGTIKLTTNVSSQLLITNVQLEQGSTATSFERRPFHTELALCQRYYQKSFAYGTLAAQNVGPAGAIGTVGVSGSLGPTQTVRFPVAMRASPTITTYNPRATNANWRNSANTTDATVVVSGTNEFGTIIGASTAPVTDSFTIDFAATAEL